MDSCSVRLLMSERVAALNVSRQVQPHRRINKAKTDQTVLVYSTCKMVQIMRRRSGPLIRFVSPVEGKFMVFPIESPASARLIMRKTRTLYVQIGQLDPMRPCGK